MKKLLSLGVLVVVCFATGTTHANANKVSTKDLARGESALLQTRMTQRTLMRAKGKRIEKLMHTMRGKNGCSEEAVAMQHYVDMESFGKEEAGRASKFDKCCADCVPGSCTGCPEKTSASPPVVGNPPPANPAVPQVTPDPIATGAPASPVSKSV